jgi:hypothetical protein
VSERESVCFVLWTLIFVVLFFSLSVGFGWNWRSFVIGILLIIIGGRGVHAANRMCLRNARQYYYGLVSVTLLSVVFSAINFVLIGVSFDSWCSSNMSYTDRDVCRNERNAMLM